MASSIHQSEHVLRPLSELRLWDKNPRRGTKDQMDRLKRKIEKHGLYKALITTKDGEILGGNMRFRILKDLGVEKVWCSIAEPKNEAEKIEIAISDNESDGEWVEEELAELIHNQPIELDLLSVHLAQPIPLRNLLEGEEAEIEEDEPPDVDAGGGRCQYCGQDLPAGFTPPHVRRQHD